MKRLAAFLTLLIVAACSDDGQLTAPDPPASPQQVSDLTPFQQSIRTSMDERSREGLPVPEVSFDYTSDNGAALSVLQGYPGSPGESFTIVATTTIRYDNPREAGMDRWPAAVVHGEIAPEEGFVRPGDYTDEVRDYVGERLPGYWDTHAYGLEPRTKRIVETMTVTYGEPGRGGPAAAAAEEDLVHGFTIVGPNIDWTVSGEDCWTVGVGDLQTEVCAYKFRAGFAFDYGFGVRLPMKVTLYADDAVDEGTTFTPTTLAQGVDWSGADYTAAGIAPESGNEFVMRYEFFLGAQVEVAEIPVLSWGPDVDVDRSSSFATPFGPGAVFSLPYIDIPLASESVATASVEFGAYATPMAGSDKFTADWLASSGLSGNGSLEYYDPSVARPLSSVFAIDGPGLGNLQIKNTEYVFSQFKVELGAYFSINIFDLWDKRYPIPITDFNLSNLIPDISVPIHAGANPTTLNAGVTIRNVAPAVGTLTGIPADPVAISDQPLGIGGAFSDPANAADEPYTCAVDHDDGSGLLAGTVSGTTCTGPDHTYAEPGVYNVTVDVSDKDGGTGSRTAGVPIVVYDPDGGFVTGGGWIDSPEGAYAPDGSLTGRAVFGFVAKYKKGATVPDGNTEFQFQDAGLDFHSDSYEWLVVNQGGSNAQFRGLGTVNGAGPYNFMLWAGDGDSDTFRIRIWSEDEGTGAETDLYDNGFAQALGGGSIVIHTK
jgi:PKD repeat protein